MAVPRAQAPFASFTETWHTTSYASIDPTGPRRAALSAAGKNVFVTGGGTGIGAHTALSFAAAGAAHMAIFGRRREKLVETQQRVQDEHPGSKVLVYVGDVTVQDDVDGAMAAFRAAVSDGGEGGGGGDGSGQLHVLVSNAGAGEELLLFEGADPAAWWRVVEVNLQGHAHAVRAFFRPGMAVDDAVVVTVSSAACFVTAFPGLTAYSASKAGAVAMNTALQYEHPRKTIVSIQPGVVDTWMHSKSGYPALDDVSLPADFCVWLASPEARFLKGTFLFANWDVDELKARAEEIEGTGTLQLWLTGLPRRNAQGDTTVFDDSRDPGGLRFKDKA